MGQWKIVQYRLLRVTENGNPVARVTKVVWYERRGSYSSGLKTVTPSAPNKSQCKESKTIFYNGCVL